jgi:hypothetical protein
MFLSHRFLLSSKGIPVGLSRSRQNRGRKSAEKGVEIRPLANGVRGSLKWSILHYFLQGTSHRGITPVKECYGLP